MISDFTPAQAWEKLSSESGCILVDVRTKAEWGFVGIPDLRALKKAPILVEWKSFPSMQTNSDFADELLSELGDTTPSAIGFLCRSGQRSMAAGMHMHEIFVARGESVECFNIAEGFEGNLDQTSHRGGINGWKARGLDWVQS